MFEIHTYTFIHLNIYFTSYTMPTVRYSFVSSPTIYNIDANTVSINMHYRIFIFFLTVNDVRSVLWNRSFIVYISIKLMSNSNALKVSAIRWTTIYFTQFKCLSALNANNVCNWVVISKTFDWMSLDSKVSPPERSICQVKSNRYCLFIK